MRNAILVDGSNFFNLWPLTYTRPAANLRCGIRTIDQKWHHLLKCRISYHTADYLRAAYPSKIEEDNTLINSAVLPTHGLVEDIQKLGLGEQINDGNFWVAARLDHSATRDFLDNRPLAAEDAYTGSMTVIQYPEDLLKYNHQEIEKDFISITRSRRTGTPDKFSRVYGEDVFIEPGARTYGASINTESGPVYLGKDAVVLAGAHLAGPVAIGEKSVLKMGAKIYGATSTGPLCKLGGEIKNSILYGFSSKSHDGYMGDSVVGAWCNFGAGTSNSNMKNTYGTVRLYSCKDGDVRDTKNQFLGMIVGDHSKCAINTSFSTGTVVGVFANIFDYDPKRFVPSFSWGRDERYLLKKALEVAGRTMERKGMRMTAGDREILTHLYNKEGSAF